MGQAATSTGGTEISWRCHRCGREIYGGTWINGAGPYCPSCCLPYRKAVACPVCGGSGLPGVPVTHRYLHPTAPLCPACGGSGVVWIPDL